MTDQWAALEQAARAATPGPWRDDGIGVLQPDDPIDPSTWGRYIDTVGSDAAYIALASPDVILRLIAAAREA